MGRKMYVISGVRMTMLSSTWNASGQPSVKGCSRKLANRLRGKNGRKMLIACFQRGGTTVSGTITEASPGCENQPSMPVRRSTRVVSIISRALSIHQRRSSDCSHPCSVSASANRYSMCHSFEPAPLRTHPEPRYPGHSRANSWPACAQAFACRVYPGRMVRATETVTGCLCDTAPNLPAPKRTRLV